MNGYQREGTIEALLESCDEFIEGNAAVTVLVALQQNRLQSTGRISIIYD
jgi:hypothetical protein